MHPGPSFEILGGHSVHYSGYRGIQSHVTGYKRTNIGLILDIRGHRWVGLQPDKKGYSEPYAGYKRTSWTFIPDIKGDHEPFIGYKRTSWALCVE